MYERNNQNQKLLFCNVNKFHIYIFVLTNPKLSGDFEKIILYVPKTSEYFCECSQTPKKSDPNSKCTLRNKK